MVVFLLNSGVTVMDKTVAALKELTDAHVMYLLYINILQNGQQNKTDIYSVW